MARSSLTHALVAGLAAAILTTTVAVAGDTAPPEGDQPPPEGDRQAQKALCKQGGYLRVVGIGDPNERVRFRNQGRCVSFVNKGGRLVGISDPED